MELVLVVLTHTEARTLSLSLYLFLPPPYNSTPPPSPTPPSCLSSGSPSPVLCCRQFTSEALDAASPFVSAMMEKGKQRADFEGKVKAEAVAEYEDCLGYGEEDESKKKKMSSSSGSKRGSGNSNCCSAHRLNASDRASCFVTNLKLNELVNCFCAVDALMLGTASRNCQAEKCAADLTEAKQYHRRHKVCEEHSKAPAVVVAGVHQRFCQQCSRFHELSEFDDNKRSCRRRLAGHNERRRKNPVESHIEGTSGKAGGAQVKELICAQVDDRGHIQMTIQENATYKHFQIR